MTEERLIWVRTIRYKNRDLNVRNVESGETLLHSDLYLASSGGWQECPCPGVAFTGAGADWVRPLVTPASSTDRRGV